MSIEKNKDNNIENEKDRGNKKFRDSIFRYVFKENENFVDLYKGLANKELSPNEIEPFDLSSVIRNNELLNDVSFLTKDNRLIVMCEHQSSFSKNFALKGFLYSADLVRKFLKSNDLKFHQRSRIDVPKIEIYYAYNGKDKISDEDIEKSSRLDIGSVVTEIKVAKIHTYNLAEEVKQNDNKLYGYSYFIEKVEEYIEDGSYTLDEAINKTIDDCNNNNIFVDIIKRKEFVSMVYEYLTIEQEKELYAKEVAKEAVTETKYDMAFRLLLNNVSDNIILDATKLTPKELADLKVKCKEEVVDYQINDNELEDSLER